MEKVKVISFKVFLGGTCAETTWRDQIIPELEEAGLEYFNPVVEDWTPECIEIENVEKTENCEGHMYVLTPDMIGVYSVAELVQSCYQIWDYDHSVILTWVGILGTEEEWGTARYKSLKAVVDLVNNTSEGKENRALFLDSVDDIVPLYVRYINNRVNYIIDSRLDE